MFLIIFFLCFHLMELHALVDFIAVSGNPATLRVQTAVAGSQPDAVSDQTTTYSITTSIGTSKIVGQLNAALPSGVTLQVMLEAPTGGTSLGLVPLNTTPSDLVTNLPIISLLSSNRSITYTLSATVNAAPFSTQNVLVTYTIM